MPGGSAVRRRNVSDIELTGGCAAAGLRICIEVNSHMCARARRRWIDTNAWDEVVECTGNGIDGNALDGTPMAAVGRRGVDEIVSGTVGAEAAVFPHNPNRPGAVHCGGGQRAAANASSIGTGLNACNWN